MLFLDSCLRLAIVHLHLHIVSLLSPVIPIFIGSVHTRVIWVRRPVLLLCSWQPFDCLYHSSHLTSSDSTSSGLYSCEPCAEDRPSSPWL